MKLRLSALAGSFLTAVVVVGAALASAGADYRASVLGETETALEDAPATAPLQAAVDSVLRTPGAVGWGSHREECYDSLWAGTGNADVIVYRVTSTAATGTATLDSALNHAETNSHRAKCQRIIFPRGGTYGDNERATHTGIRNLRVSGQTAQGIVNIDDSPEIRSSFSFMVEYVTSRRFGTGDGLFRPNCTRHVYMRHISASWYGANNNLISNACGTVAVPLTGDTARYATFEHLLLGEPDDDSPTHMHLAGNTGPSRLVRQTVTESFFGGPGHRYPLLSDGDSMTVLRIISHNAQARWGAIADSIGKTNWFEIKYVDGAATPDTTDLNSSWPLFVRDKLEDTLNTKFHIAAVQHIRNSFDRTVVPDSLVFGSHSKRVVACNDNISWCTADGDTVLAEIVNKDTLSTAVETEGELSFDALTASKEDDILDVVGNYRYLNCRGGWVARRDSVDDRFISEYATSEASPGSGGPNTAVDGATGRTYPDPDRGTACADTDSDGLPNEYEAANAADSVALDVDSMSNGRPAIDWYLDGQDLDATEIASATFGTDRFVLHTPVSHVDTFCPPTGDCGGAASSVDSLDATTITANQSSWSTGSFTPTASARMYLLFEAPFGGTQADPDSVIGHGVTWTEVLGPFKAGANHGWVFEAQASGSPSSDNVTVYQSSGASNAHLIVVEITESDSTVQSASNTGSGTAASVTLASFDDATNNVAFGFFWTDADNALSVGSGFTELANLVETETGAGHALAEYQTGEATTVDASLASSDNWAGIALEAEGGGGAASDTIFFARLDPDTVPPESVQCSGIWYNSDTTEALCVPWATDTPSVTSSILDSAQVDSLCTDWGTCTEGGLKGISIAALWDALIDRVLAFQGAVERWAQKEVAPLWH